MEREQLKGKQTPGTITTKLCGTYGPDQYEIHWSEDGECTAEVVHGHANAALYAEAHNVANEHGMWPLDMLARIRELEEAVSEARQLVKGVRELGRMPNGLDKAIHILEEAILNNKP